MPNRQGIGQIAEVIELTTRAGDGVTGRRCSREDRGGLKVHFTFDIISLTLLTADVGIVALSGCKRCRLLKLRH